MELTLIIGAIMGCGYFIVKLGFFHLITTKNLRRWIHRKPLIQAILDCGFGYLGMHVFTLAGGTIISMIAFCSFAACSMLYIFTHLTINKVGDKMQEVRNVNLRRLSV